MILHNVLFEIRVTPFSHVFVQINNITPHKRDSIISQRSSQRLS